MISVIVPFFNSSVYLEDALTSIAIQDVVGIEVIVVDDGSDHEESLRCQQISARFPDLKIKILRQANSGASAARNLGAKHSTNEYLAFLDSDDIWLAGKLRSQLNLLIQQKAELIIGNVIVANENLVERYSSRKSLPSNNEDAIVEFFLGNITMNTPTLLIKKDFFDAVGGFDQRLLHREDHFFLMSCLEHGTLILDPAFLTVRRERAGSLSGIGSLQDELEKNALFWELSERQFNKCDPIKARKTLVKRLSFFFLRKGDAENIRECLNSLPQKFSASYLVLRLMASSRLVTKLVFLVRDKARELT